MPESAVSLTNTELRRSLRIRFATFYHILESFMYAEDECAGLYEKYASPKEQIGLERSQFIKLWKEQVKRNNRQYLLTLLDDLPCCLTDLLLLPRGRSTRCASRRRRP